MESANPTNSLEQSRKFEETKRRKREGIVILVTALMVAALIFFEVQLPDVSPEYSLGSNVLFFLLININVILLILLVFLVVRNLVKLVFERKRRILGSRLQVRLVLAFVALSLVPSVATTNFHILSATCSGGSVAETTGSPLWVASHK